MKLIPIGAATFLLISIALAFEARSAEASEQARTWTYYPQANGAKPIRKAQPRDPQCVDVQPAKQVRGSIFSSLSNDGPVAQSFQAAYCDAEEHVVPVYDYGKLPQEDCYNLAVTNTLECKPGELKDTSIQVTAVVMIGSLGEGLYASDLQADSSIVHGEARHDDFFRVYSDLSDQDAMKYLASNAAPFKGLPLETAGGEKFNGSFILDVSANLGAVVP